MKDFIQSAESLQDELVACRRHLHQTPEIGLSLPNTTAFVIEKLKAYGYAPTLCGGGVVATCGKGNSGKTFMLRADMDALPIREESGEPFSATNGCMHACGHDFHTTMLLGCAKLLKENESAIEGTVKLMFQPGEEVALGAKTMIEAGVLKNPDVDAAMMIHVLSGVPGVANGDVVVMAEGAASANTDAFRINVKGKGGHGAKPHETVDPINVMAHMHTALQAINAREVDAAELFTMTIGEIQAGSTNNVIPDTGYMRGTIRSFGKPVRTFLKARLSEISESVAKTFRADAEVIFEFEVPSVINAGSVRREALTAMQSLFGDTVKDASTYAGGMFARITGSEDFGFVSEEVPSLMVGLVAGIPADGHRYPMHHPMATFDERVLWKGAAVYAHTAMAWLKMYYKPIDLPRNMDQMLEAASESMRTAVEKYTAEALAQGRWSEPEEYDMNPANMAFAAYWLHKIRKPIVKGMKGFGLEAYFEKFKQNQSTWMPEAFTVDKTYRISASGDLMFGKYVEDSNGVLYQAVESLIFDADCAYANLESTLSKEVPKALSVEKEGDTPTINLTAAQYEVLIQHSGKRYDVLQIANNHIFDCGLEGAEMTMAQLESDGIAYTGVYKSKESSEAIVCTQMADVKIGWISHTFNLNINPLSAEEAWRCDLTPFHIVKSPDTTRIQKQIAKAREIGCDLVILTLHWGLEHEFYPHPDQLKWAHEFAELGVDAIIGHHPHVCQPYECYTPMHDPEKRVPILYSLGNLTPVYGAPATVLSLIANLTVAKGSMNGTQKTLITGIEITPVAYVGMVLQNKNYAALVPLKTLSETAMSEEMAAYFDEITPYADLVLGKTWR